MPHQNLSLMDQLFKTVQLSTYIGFLKKIPFQDRKIDCVIHCAALKAVGESFVRALDYYHNNITGACHLLQVMDKHKVWQPDVGTCDNWCSIAVLRYHRIQIFIPQYKILHSLKFYCTPQLWALAFFCGIFKAIWAFKIVWKAFQSKQSLVFAFSLPRCHFQYYRIPQLKLRPC